MNLEELGNLPNVSVHVIGREELGAPAPAQEGQSWGEVYEEQVTAEEAAAGKACHACGGRPEYIGTQDGFWYRCQACELEQTLEELAPETYRVEVVTSRDEPWAGNALEYETRGEAEEAARDLATRWTLVRMARVVPTSTPRREESSWTDPGPIVVDYR